MQREWLTEEEAADYLAVKRDTLASYRYRKTVVIPYSRIGNGPKAAVRYRKRDLDAYLEARMVTA